LDIRHGVLIYNPAAGQGDLTARLQSLLPKLATEGLELESRPTAGPGDAAAIARESIAGGARLIVVCGGDGTINEAALAVSGSEAALAVLPGGTANVLARELKIPRSLKGAARVLLEGRPVKLSVGKAGERRFLMMAGFGLDAVVLMGFNRRLKRYLGRVAYAARCAEELARFRAPHLRVRAEGIELEGTMVVAANIRLYGGDFVLAPSADPTDQFLDITVLQGRTLLDYGRYAAGLLAGKLHTFGDVATFRARALHVESDAGEVPGQVDGETVLRTPIDISLEPGALTVLVPSSCPYDPA
jgi:diacylglycerol kinase (ATP)